MPAPAYHLANTALIQGLEVRGSPLGLVRVKPQLAEVAAPPHPDHAVRRDDHVVPAAGGDIDNKVALEPLHGLRCVGHVDPDADKVLRNPQLAPLAVAPRHHRPVVRPHHRVLAPARDLHNLGLPWEGRDWVWRCVGDAVSMPEPPVKPHPPGEELMLPLGIPLVPQVRTVLDRLKMLALSIADEAAEDLAARLELQELREGVAARLVALDHLLLGDLLGPVGRPGDVDELGVVVRVEHGGVSRRELRDLPQESPPRADGRDATLLQVLIRRQRRQRLNVHPILEQPRKPLLPIEPGDALKVLVEGNLDLDTERVLPLLACQVQVHRVLLVHARDIHELLLQQSPLALFVGLMVVVSHLIHILTLDVSQVVFSCDDSNVRLASRDLDDILQQVA
mmetsp:Transcript_29297/g.72337  ORF Transcript_29297/g.72337 Transcript_29297/m.72337 type:complete len:394 (-) Transcript_29297:2019-3200(-)